jgi:AcrR family transcriptional regulator
MSTVDEVQPRRRDAAASAQALFDAATELFGQKGFDATTTREIGELAGVDPSLIARYFGSKADLYIAVVAREPLDEGDRASFGDGDQPLADLTAVAELVLRRSDLRGPGPILQALIRQDTAHDVRVAAQGRLIRRIIEPLTEQFRLEGLDEPALRATLSAAALFGVSLARSLHWFDELAEVPRDQLVALVVEVLGATTAANLGSVET